MSRQFTLGKKERLKSRKQTEQLFREGKKFVVACLRVHYLVTKESESPLQFGAGVSARQFKRAVDRNRVKRLIRESVRLQKIPLQEQLIAAGIHLRVFIIYTGKELPQYPELFAATGKLLSKLRSTLSTSP